MIKLIEERSGNKWGTTCASHPGSGWIISDALKSELFFCLSHLSCHFRCDISVCVCGTGSQQGCGQLYPAVPAALPLTVHLSRPPQGWCCLLLLLSQKLKLMRKLFAFHLTLEISPVWFVWELYLAILEVHPCFLLDLTRKREFLLSQGGIAFLHRGRSGSWFCFTHQEASPAELLWWSQLCFVLLLNYVLFYSLSARSFFTT